MKWLFNIFVIGYIFIYLIMINNLMMIFDYQMLYYYLRSTISILWSLKEHTKKFVLMRTLLKRIVKKNRKCSSQNYLVVRQMLLKYYGGFTVLIVYIHLLLNCFKPDRWIISFKTTKYITNTSLLLSKNPSARISTPLVFSRQTRSIWWGEPTDPRAIATALFVYRVSFV